MKTKTNTLLGAVLFLLVIGAAALALPPVALAQAANTVVAWEPTATASSTCLSRTQGLWLSRRAIHSVWV
jgi:hypothetical protein